jgi:hypothetical protein
VAGRQLAPDLPELLEVVVSRSLGRLHAEGRVAPRPADAGHLVAAFRRIILRKESPEAAEAVVDQPLRQLMVGYDGETVTLEAAGETLDERGRIVRREPVADGNDGLGHGGKTAGC